MNRADKRRQQKLAKKNTKKARGGSLPQSGADQPLSVDHAIKTAIEFVEQHKLPEALEYVNAVLAENPNHPDGLCVRGVIFFAENRFNMAASYLKRALDLMPGHQSAQHYLDQIDQRMKTVRSSPYLAEFVSNQAVYMDYPRNIGIETVGKCNANCGFCPHESLERKFTDMDEDLFDKIISDLEKIPAHIPLTIFPNIVNEPFMDRKIFPRLKKINDRLPQANLSIFTNFNVVHRNFFNDLAQVKNISDFNVSFNAANEEEYVASMQIDFNRTVENLKTLMTKNREEKFLMEPIILSRVASLSDADNIYVDECTRLFSDYVPGEDFIPHVKNRTNWLGEMDGAQSLVPNDMPCNAWFDINIFCNGVVPHCCMDATGKHSIGDVRTSSVLEVYNSPNFKFMREKLNIREGVHPCNTCSLLQ